MVTQIGIRSRTRQPQYGIDLNDFRATDPLRQHWLDDRLWRSRSAVPDDRTIGAFGWLKDHDHGAESFNFAAARGKVFGYISGFKGVNIGNLGAPKNAEFIEGVTVVWMATDPNSKRKLIVGWYRDATVFRVPQSNATTNARGIPGFIVSADVKNATLLRPEFRSFELLSSRVIERGYGQSPVWYDRRGRYRKDVLAHLAGEERQARRSGKKPPRNNDPEARKVVEQIAVDHAWSYFEAAGYTMRTVERDAVGWDLEARAAGKPMLKIEVKGLKKQWVRASSLLMSSTSLEARSTP